MSSLALLKKKTSREGVKYKVAARGCQSAEQILKRDICDITKC